MAAVSDDLQETAFLLSLAMRLLVMLLLCHHRKSDGNKEIVSEPRGTVAMMVSLFE